MSKEERKEKRRIKKEQKAEAERIAAEERYAQWIALGPARFYADPKKLERDAMKKVSADLKIEKYEKEAEAYMSVPFLKAAHCDLEYNEIMF